MNILPDEMMGPLEFDYSSAGSSGFAQSMIDEEISERCEINIGVDSKIAKDCKKTGSLIRDSNNVSHIMDIDSTTGRVALNNGLTAFRIQFAENLKSIVGSDKKEKVNAIVATDESLSQIDTTEHLIEVFSQTASNNLLKFHLKKFLSIFLLKTPSFIKQSLFKGWFSGKKMKEKLIDERNKLIKELNELSEKKEPISSSEENTLSERCTLLMDKILDVDKDLSGLIEGAKKGKKARNQLVGIGGEHFRVTTKDQKATIDGMYLSASKFKQKLKGIDAKEYTITLPKAKKEIRGFMVPKDKLDSTAFKSLEGLGWVGVKDSDGNLMMMSPSDLDVLTQEKLVEKKDGESYFAIIEPPQPNTLKISKREMKVTDGQNNGVAIITSGNTGVYEMSKHEMFAFLMKGVDVVGFNFRGYGNSTGTPSADGFKDDFRAVYDYVQEHHPVSDDKILLKALCMSGGPAAAFAKEHPKANIMLDQSYSSVGKLIKQQAKNQLNVYLDRLQNDPEHGRVFKAMVGWLAENFESLTIAIVKMLAPSWEVHEDLKNVEGRIGVLSTDNDTLMPFSTHMKKLYLSLLKNKTGIPPMFFSMEGKHSTSWVNNFQQIERIKPTDDLLAVIDEYAFRIKKQKGTFIEFEEGKNELKKCLKDVCTFVEENEIEEIMKELEKDLDSIKQKADTIPWSETEAAIKKLLKESDKIKNLVKKSPIHRYSDDYDINEKVDELAEQVSKSFSTKYDKALNNIYSSVHIGVQNLKSNELTPEKLLETIKEKFKLLDDDSPEMRKIYHDFILETCGIDVYKLIDHPELFVPKNLAEAFIDHFLQSAKLGTQLWCKHED